LSTWQVSGRDQSLTPLPFGLRIAGMGPRLGAWFLDLVFFGLLSVIPLVLASISGAVGLNPEALRQETGDAYFQPTVPWLVVNMGPLIAWAAVWVVLAIVYSAACWSRFRGLPGQRLVSLQVADAATGKNLSPPRALVRAVLVSGVPAAATAVLLVAVFEVLATVNASDLSGPGNADYLHALETGPWSGLVSLCDTASWAWPLVLLVSTVASRDRRGIHDKLAGSIVVARGIVPGAWGYAYGPGLGAPFASPYGPGPAYGPGPGYAPGPGYPYGPQPGPPGQPPVWPGAYPWPQVPRTDPGEEAAAPPPDAGGAEPSARPPVASPDAGGAEPAPRKAVSDNPQVFGARLPEGLRVARFNRRAAGYVLDTIVVIGLFGGIGTAVLGSTDPSGPSPPERLVMLAGLLSGMAQAAYFVAMWCLWRGSIGQKALGLQVGDESTGHRLSWADALVRWAVLQGPLALYLAVPDVMRPLVGVVAIGWIWLLIYSARRDPDGRGYHDRIAHSLVVEQA
jgi:uncharacterized RDD family membrane protein YckC